VASIEWTEPAFAQLEKLDTATAYAVIRRVDLLEKFPEMGIPLKARRRASRHYRQLIVGSAHRIVYEYAVESATVYILAVQHCRQRLPSASQLRRRREGGEANTE
jgi:mRNA-degrading endonuclease RelE of RelBE toxin-antitoxin system